MSEINNEENTQNKITSVNISEFDSSLDNIGSIDLLGSFDKR